MQRLGTLETMGWLLKHQPLRILLIAAPGVTAVVGVLTARESAVALALVLNAVVGIAVSSALFIVVSMFAKQMADERSGLVRATEPQRTHSATHRLSIYDDNGLFTDWYFRLRVQEEIERSQRYDLEFSVLVIRPKPIDGASDGVTATTAFTEKVRQCLRKSDLLALLRDGSVGVLLPIKGHRAAAAVKRRMTSELALLQANVGIANYPEHGQSSAALLAVAAHAALSGAEGNIAA